MCLGSRYCHRPFLHISFRWNGTDRRAWLSECGGMTVSTTEADDRRTSVICSWDMATTSEPEILTRRLSGLRPATSATLRGSTSAMTASRVTWKPSWAASPWHSVNSSVYKQTHHGPDVQNILWQSHDYLMIMPKLRSTYDRRLIHKPSYEECKAFLRHDSLAGHNHRKVMGKTRFVQFSTTWAITCSEMVHQRPRMTREMETWLSDSRVGNNSVTDVMSDHIGRQDASRGGVCSKTSAKKVARTRLLSTRFRSWSRFLAVSLQVTWVINPV